MSNARTLANTINSSSQIVVPSGGVQFADTTNDPYTSNSVSNESNLISQDGYEEGTFSFSVRGTSGTGDYTKIGRLVNCQISFSGTAGSTPDNNISLPFSNSGGQINGDGGYLSPRVSTSTNAYFKILAGVAYIQIHNPTVSNNASVDIYLNFSYFTS